MSTAMLINCTNYFNEVGCERLSKALENGETVRIHIDCIGHTRTYYETGMYVEWLNKKYGERLVIDKDDCENKIYYLKD